MEILELSVPFGRGTPSFSCIPLSQCKRREVCCKERLHVTVFGKNAILSPERALNTINITVFRTCFQPFLCGAILGLVKSHGVPSTTLSSSIGFVIVKNTDCLPLLRLRPPGINTLLIMEFISLAFPTW